MAIIDSQSTKTTGKGARGYDESKNIKGRKCQIAVDTQGNLLTVIVHSAEIQDRISTRSVLMCPFRRFDTIAKVFADCGYTGSLIDWAQRMVRYDVVPH